MRNILLSTAAAVVVAGAALSGPAAGQALLQSLLSTIEADVAADLSQFGITTPVKPVAPTTTSAVDALPTATPIKHLVVIFNENRSFDHYFGHYPVAANVAGEPAFTAAPGTPTPNNYLSNPELLTQNPNLNLANDTQVSSEPVPNTGATNPFRIDRAQFNTAGQNHSYGPEQQAFDNGAADLFPKFVGSGSSAATATGITSAVFDTKGQNLGYFDGNTVTALWNYAQNYAINDNSWSDTFGPSTPGLLEMFAGNNNGIVPTLTAGGKLSGNALPDGTAVTNPPGFADGFSLIGDIDPTMDICSPQSPAFFTLGGLTTGGGTTAASNAPSIGGALKAAGIPFGSFVGGFDLTKVNANGSTGCAGVTVNPTTGALVFSPTNGGRSTMSPNTLETQNDYTQHHIWFQYFAATANPMHTLPVSTAEVGHDGPANHGYDLAEFFTAVSAGNYPAVSFIKMAGFQDEHPGNSNALDAQNGIVTVVNFLQQQPDWKNTAVIIAYDDSDGWYDHAFIQPTTRASFTTNNLTTTTGTLTDQLNGNGLCGIQAAGATEPVGVNNVPVAGRCGPGMRQPFVVISPWAKKNFIDHTFTTQASIPRFIEDNWLKGVRLGGGSYDAQTGSIMAMFNFNQIFGTKLILNDTSDSATSTTAGTVVSSSTILLQ